jgi:pyrroline-5-carboxylate reductase
VTIKKVEELLQRPLKVIRTMPNTPALVGMAMTALCPNKKVTEEELQQVKELFSSFGKAELLPESQINAFTSLCGSSPAWIFMAIEALADGAVLQGIPRDKAYPMVAQAVAGSAKMVLDSGEHPAVLKDRVCSPGGTTIEAVAQLEKDGLRASLIEAVRVCTAKADRLSGD